MTLIASIVTFPPKKKLEKMLPSTLDNERETSKITVLLFHKTIFCVRSQATLAHGRVARGGLLTQQLLL